MDNSVDARISRLLDRLENENLSDRQEKAIMRQVEALQDQQRELQAQQA